MKAFKITIVSILSLIDLYILYSAIGYLIWGAKTPKIVGVENTCFMGMYIMSITYFCIFVILTSVLVFLSIKFFKKKTSKNQNTEK